MKLYSVYDSVAETWSPPFLQENDRSAWRSFQQLVASNPSVADDVKLFSLSYWHSNSREPMGVVGSPEEVSVASVMKEYENV